MLALEHAVLARGPRVILPDADLAIRPGEVLALLGPNGAGKSTLLKALSGELAPASGRAALDGRDLKDWPASALARRRSVLPQHNHLAFGFAVEDVVALGRSAHIDHAARADDQRAITGALTAVGLASFAARDYRKLSGGEQQRVHLARALAQIWEEGRPTEPRYLLLDEPVSNLDPAYQQTVLRTARLMAERGCGVVISLHDLNLAAAFADRVLLIAEGRFVAEGTPAEVLTPQQAGAVYGLPMLALRHPETGAPVLLPAMGEAPRA
ncbi:MAG TPA: heme ABC transporter ATP-binding protein [Hypericibacter adhaerens]|jgi:iron complex transport system ATP-binding protein|uniref:heme ABC transporter ATP-binding protein n=1 Tax=Hypericibacter adhaerens TaxID=2602016 RepID=UPI002C38745C|nr:heme ABC transporter ATP-binding protein [Hypericibacter adhaerens]HWA43778.1 heme ABC transporter ATP-binding protein [Hypericibacter adhaerens]